MVFGGSHHVGCFQSRPCIPPALQPSERDRAPKSLRYLKSVDINQNDPATSRGKRSVCCARWPDEADSLPSTSGSSQGSSAWGAWGRPDAVGANDRATEGLREKPSNGARKSNDGRGSKTPNRRARARDNAAPAKALDENAWESGAIARSQPPKMAGSISRQLQPFSRGGLQISSFAGDTSSFESSDPTLATRFPQKRSPGESTADDESDGAPDAVCDGDLSAAPDDDDAEGLLLEAADIMRDTSLTEQLRAAEDFSAIREVLYSSPERLSAWNIAQTVHSMGRLARSLSPAQLRAVSQDPLMAELMAVVDVSIAQFTAIPLTMTLWGIASLRFMPGSVMTKILRAVEAQLEDMEPRHLSMVMWSLGRLEVHPGEALMDAITKRCLLVLVDMKPQSLSNLAWTYARLRERRIDILDAIAAEAEQRITSLNTQALSNIAWAYAKLSHDPPGALLASIESQALLRFPELSSQSIANILWASAMHGRKPAALLNKVAAEIKACSLQFQPDDLTHIMVALALMQHRDDEKLVQTVLAQCVRNLPSYSPGVISGILWAVAELQSESGRKFAEHVLPVITPAVSKLSYNHTANLCFSLGKLGVTVQHELAAALTWRVCENARLMTAKQLGGTALGLSKALGFKAWQLKHMSKQIVNALEARIKARAASPQDILLVMAAENRIRRHDRDFTTICLQTLLEHIRAGRCSATDLAATAHVFGKYRWGRAKGCRDDVAALYLEIQAACVPFMAGGQFSPRHLASVVWGHGRVGVRFSNQAFMHAVSTMLIEEVKEFKAIDVANILTGLVSMDLSPGLLALDGLADHLNNRYSEYQPHELAQALYGFSRFHYHPGAAVGRIRVMYRKQPELFDKNATYNLEYAFKTLDDTRVLEQDRVVDRMSDADVELIIKRGYRSGPFIGDRQDYEAKDQGGIMYDEDGPAAFGDNGAWDRGSLLQTSKLAS